MSDLSQPPIYVIRLGAPKAEQTAETEAEPYLIVSTTSIYTWIYNDSGSGAHSDVSLYRPAPSDSSFFIIGDYAQNNYTAPAATSYIVKAVNDDPTSPLIKPPSDYSEIWDDKGSGGNHDGSVWFPVPPDGYVSIGFVGQTGYSKPAIPSYACLRKDLCVDSTAGLPIWDDKGSGAHGDIEIWQINGVPGSFVAQSNYNPYVGPCRKLIST